MQQVADHYNIPQDVYKYVMFDCIAPSIKKMKEKYNRVMNDIEIGRIIVLGQPVIQCTICNVDVKIKQIHNRCSFCNMFNAEITLIPDSRTIIKHTERISYIINQFTRFTMTLAKLTSCTRKIRIRIPETLLNFP